MFMLEYHNQVINGSPVATFVIDAAHRVVYWNRACEALTRLSSSEAVGSSQQWRAFYPSPRVVMADLIVDQASEKEILELYKGTGRKSLLVDGAYEVESFFPNLGDDGKWLFFTAAPLHDESGSVIGAIETLQDITDRRVAEGRVKILNQELEQLVSDLQNSLHLLKETQHQLIQSEKMAALGGLVAGVAHEINTPVGISVTAASLLDEKTRDCALLFESQALKRSELQSYMQLARDSSGMILSNLRRASDLINSFKQVAVDQTCEQPGVFNLRDCIDNIVMTMRPTLRKTSHTVKVDCPENLELDSYPGAIGQVLSNLILNSLLHGFENIEGGTVLIEVSENDGDVEISYRDNGNGIPENHIERIFEPFFTTKRNNGGTGLGLHILYNLVTQTLNGRISCESSAGKGVLFSIVIPRLTAFVRNRQ
ncbi:MAG: PAS domain-containing sensor histidine kinase [Desulfuromonadaceae bacterium]|nr:PAS domain-containing sensor histidine kinase [Desulfuromonadaceae bacterium]MDD2855004.1 PAS domain-containing sensor histidine kinase [Desulfuromonadaceae bacterium]